MLTQIKSHMSRAQEVIKASADKHMHDFELAMGSKVFLKLHPYMQHSVARRLYQKLVVKFYGPYEILEKVGKAEYHLQLPPSSKIHSVFHVSQLKPDLGKIFRSILFLPPSLMWVNW